MGLKYLFGAHEAEIIQQIAYWREKPFRDYYLNLDVRTKMHEGRVFVRMPPRSLLDRWTGRLRHMSEKTFDRKIGSCKKQGVILTANLNTDGRDTTNWYAIVEEVIKPVTDIYEHFLERVITERRDSFEREGEPLSKLREDILWRDFQAALRGVRAEVSEIAKELGLGGSQGQFDPTPGTNNFLSSGPVMLTLREETISLSAEGQNDSARGDNLTPPLLYTENEILLNTTTTLFVAADAAVAAQSSIDNLQSSGRKAVARLKPSKPAEPESPSDQTSLPLVAPTAKSKRLPKDTAHQAAEMTARLLALAEEVMVDLSDEEAATIVGSWPQSSQSRPAIVEQMNRLGLSKKVSVEMLKENEAACRWHLVCWPRRPQVSIGYFKTEGGKANGTRIGAFRDSITSEWPPFHGEGWINEMRAEIADQKRRVKFEADKEEANDYFQGLSLSRRKRFIEGLLKEKLWEKGISESGSDAWDKVRVSMLLDPAIREQLSEWGAKPAAPESAETGQEPESVEAIDPKVVARLQRYVTRLRFDIEDGKFPLDELGAKARGLEAVTAAEAKWVEAEVLAVLSQRKAA